MFIAHINFKHHIQTLETHLTETAKICRYFAEKFNLPLAGELLGLMHDFGKYSSSFQNYIQSATGIINPDEDDYVDAKGLKGKIDHSTAGAQWVFNTLHKLKLKHDLNDLCGQMLAICIASHHSGLIDSFDFTSSESTFYKRIQKEDERTHLQECLQVADHAVLTRAQQLASLDLIKELLKPIKDIFPNLMNKKNCQIEQFYLGHYTRLLFSCLIDADRINSSDFEFHQHKNVRRLFQKPNWDLAIDTLETYLSKFQIHHAIDHKRKEISDKCRQRAEDVQGIYTLSVPTGGGKTLASLRYALHHAKKHNLDRIIFIIPYTSIIEQNAQAVREVLGQQQDGTDWVFEHHSNIEPEQQTWITKLISENWDAPIIFTTMVQFLESNFSGGTRNVRRLHQMTNAVLVFDEIQTLPIKCTHLFVNVINFLKTYGRTTTVLCTATQPTLHLLDNEEKGQIQLSDNSEIMGNAVEVQQLFNDLERVKIHDQMTPQGWSLDDMVELAVEKFQATSSVLFIVNTKKLAQQLYQALLENDIPNEALFHLSTNQCAQHRKDLLTHLRHRLKQKQPVLCISTQLIEAGVDISTAVVIRCLAGLDSIAQAAGRCNRHGEMKNEKGELIQGNVYIINPADENLDKLPEIKEGKNCAARMFNELNNQSQQSILSPTIIQRYFGYYFYERQHVMSYIFEKENSSDSVFNLLGNNYPAAHRLSTYADKKMILRQSFKQAADVFKSIDAPTQAVIVHYAEGKELIKDLSELDPQKPQEYYDKLRQLQRKAQKYSVNVFPFVWQKLIELQAVHEVVNTGIYTLDEQYYSDAFGLSVSAVGKMDDFIF